MANPLQVLPLKPSGFQIIQEVPINAPPKKVWATLQNVGEWFFLDPKAFQNPRQTLELWAGGRWFVQTPEGVALLFAFVSHIEPEKLLRLTGPFGLPHLPASNAVIFELQPKDGGKSTLLRLGHRCFGFLDPEAENRFTGGWQKQLASLKTATEKN